MSDATVLSEDKKKVLLFVEHLVCTVFDKVGGVGHINSATFVISDSVGYNR